MPSPAVSRRSGTEVTGRKNEKSAVAAHRQKEKQAGAEGHGNLLACAGRKTRPLTPRRVDAAVDGTEHAAAGPQQAYNADVPRVPRA